MSGAVLQKMSSQGRLSIPASLQQSLQQASSPSSAAVSEMVLNWGDGEGRRLLPVGWGVSVKAEGCCPTGEIGVNDDTEKLSNPRAVLVRAEWR